ncbi:MAG: hypothetical protein CMF19_07345 [Idiomarinaceae bacterium]|nr:hypothetical protein [Idiomarinaceae bacterium]
MARTAVEEMWGGTFQPVPTGSPSACALPLPSGVPGAARFIDNRTDTTNLLLPDARLLPTGGALYTIYVNKPGGGTTNVKDDAGTTLLNMNQHEVAHLYLLDNSTQAGTWHIVEVGTASISSAQTIQIDEFTIEFGPGMNLDANIRTMCDDLGYAGTNPARVNVFVGPQGAATVGAVGSSSTSSPALDTGTFPAGSIIILTVLANGYIAGRGGSRGPGQPITGGTSGSPTYGSVVLGGNGGDGLYIRTQTVMYNYGRVQGGGGGGSGGSAVGDISGPGGGGGAGHQKAIAGPAGSFPAGQGFSSGGNGLAGLLNHAGEGGGTSNGAPAGTGGAGGDPGQAGNNASDGTAGGGSAGFAIKVASGVTFTKAVAGNIDGSEGTI